MIEDSSFLNISTFDHAKGRGLFSKMVVLPNEIKQRIGPVFIVFMTVLAKTFSMQDRLIQRERSA